jgi:hypothetical protein
MQTFTDRLDKSWDMQLTVSSLKRVRDLAKADLGAMIEDPTQAKRLDDMTVMGRVIYAVVKPQADASSITEDAFLELLDGPAMSRAAGAFWQELESFFRPCLPLVGGLIALAIQVRRKARSDETPPLPPASSGTGSTSSPAPSE